MSWNNVIPAELLIAEARRLGIYSQLELDLPPEYFIDEEYLTNVIVRYSWINGSGGKNSTTSRVDHPSFTGLREHLGARGYIEIERGWWNGDKVLKPFKLNTYDFKPGDQFSSASAMGNHFRVKQKNETGRKSIETERSI